MKYRYGDLYQLAEDESYQTKIHPPEDIETHWVSLLRNGFMVVKEQYAFDGPSGPIKMIAEKLGKIPFVGKWLKEKYLKHVLIPSLFHDAGYQLLRLELLPPSYREKFDELLRDMCIKSGMMEWRANNIYNGVRIGAEWAADPKNKKVVYEV